MSDKLISMIMPSLNSERFIEESILSFVNNKYPQKELVIVDGKSTDRTHCIIAKYEKEYDFIKWINASDLGLSDAINIGIEHARGDIIGYLGSDDLLNEETLYKVNEYKKFIDFDGIYFDSYTYFFAKKHIVLRKCPNILFNKRNLIKYGTIVGLQNIFFDSRVYNDFKYDLDNNFSMDYEIYFQILKKFTNFLYVEYPATINIFHENITHKMKSFQMQESFKVMYKHIPFSKPYLLPHKRLFFYYVGKLGFGLKKITLFLWKK